MYNVVGLGILPMVYAIVFSNRTKSSVTTASKEGCWWHQGPES